MTREMLCTSIRKSYDELLKALNGNDLDQIKKLTLDVHAMLHPSEISGIKDKTIADHVLDYMLAGNKSTLVPRWIYDTDLHYAGTETTPLCWQFWHTYRIEDLVSNILMADQEQIFNDEWQRKIGVAITDTGNALELEEAVRFGENLNAEALRDYILTVGKNTRKIIEQLTIDQIYSMVPEEQVVKILEVGGVTTDIRSVWLLVFWGRLKMGDMIATPITNHHMMHLEACINHLPILK